ncbi:glucan endo-1,3-beta-glucosidase [Brachypodium distachyon]|uniref:glucan endo-1,3-beta-D-glucosidase n=1 Tax=Brachypodium distachyon TaxID=15368 RepID=I1J3G4_BRADI|nr:glucan endo-1,3-beta-glucosidase [Brachypodium distachyon]KQJ85345.1 hypothetical protein BRADI_5g26467v3 [Brachypodium distachyon]|eukprot:XP_003580840.1 glucan endo-1,3-beta-glucosidase [Brachypodium distachyon]
MLATILLLLLSITVADGASIGVVYGRRATRLPPPSSVARFLARGTVFNRVRLRNADPVAVRAFAGTGLAVDVTVPNKLLPRLAASQASARRWVRANVALHVAAGVNVSRILVGHEVASQTDVALALALAPAMENLHAALLGAGAGAGAVEVSTAHSLSVLATSSPPSAGKFSAAAETVMKPVLAFLRATGAPFMVNAYPYYALTGAGDDDGNNNDTRALDFALFRGSSIAAGVMDPGTGLLYTNALDAELDAAHAAMARLGFGDGVDLAVAETGWPSAGEDWEPAAGAGAASLAAEYNRNAVRHLGSGVGTPLMPGRAFEVSICSLFDEDLRPGPVSERRFGLFRADDFSPVYDAGILSAAAAAPEVSVKVTPAPETNTTKGGQRQWCVPKPAADVVALQDNIDFACGQGGGGVGVDCGEIRPGGSCYEPDTVEGHAAYAMNLYFRSSGGHEFDCEFGHTGAITTVDPSFGSCKFT